MEKSHRLYFENYITKYWCHKQTLALYTLPYIAYPILYFTFTLPKLWHTYMGQYLQIVKLVKLQKWAIRTISNSHYRSHTGPLLAKCNVLTVSDMYTLELGVFMYRFSIGDLPVAFKNYFSKRSDIHEYPTRHVNDLNLTNNKKSFSDHTIRTRGPIL